MGSIATVGNDVLRLEMWLEGPCPCARLVEQATGFAFAEGPLRYAAAVPHPEGRLVAAWPMGASVSADGDTLTIRGTLAGLLLVHAFRLPAAHPYMEETVTLRNPGTSPVGLEDLRISFTRRVADHYGNVLPDLRADRFCAVPFLHRATDPEGFDNDLGFADLMRLLGRAPRATEAPLNWPTWGGVPDTGRASEGWAWEHGARALGIYKLNQAGMEFSVVEPLTREDGVAICFGGAGMYAGDPSALRSIATGATIVLGVTRYQPVANDRREAWYAFRAMQDEQGCRFPQGYNPPVHWNELYDNPEYNLGSPGKPPAGPTRHVTYTTPLIEQEAAKAVAYGCESLYLDPGWDTAFGTLLWGEKWLGNRRAFVDMIRAKYGLAVALHCPLATWMSHDGRGTATWPQALQKRRDGSMWQGAVCQGATAYVDEAARRLIACCDDGVSFLMFDGNWWNGGCWDETHGHPVPYTFEDHARAQLELARRVHEKHPRVLIEQHDYVSGGVLQRHTPVYYTHGLPGSYDENWGFELMWNPMEDIRTGRARSLYWYNLGCNVPVYLHIDLREDNEHCLVLWWYASTCRHLGIGGTHPDPRVAEAQRRAMATYRSLDRCFKRGDFHGAGENVHVHALPGENAFVVNLFNPSAEERIVEGAVSLARMGLDPDRWYVMPKGGRCDRTAGTFVIGRRMAPWSAQVAEVRAITP